MNHLQRREALAISLLGLAYDALTPVQKSVVDLMVEEAPTAASPSLAVDDRDFWQRLADRMSSFGGSWTFLLGFAAAVAGWTAINGLLALYGRAFDPYPFIFLNLLLSTLAAVQAPVILMSQNRQAQRDRMAAEHDYRVNLRAELEIMRIDDRLQASLAQLARIEAALAAAMPLSRAAPTPDQS